ncbi:MAG: PhaM family polyhydroxyalkanoate granule multifunctional regulatory protein [Janthinobacterium lividum]
MSQPNDPLFPFAGFMAPMGADVWKKMWESMPGMPGQATTGGFGPSMPGLPPGFAPLLRPEDMEQRIAELRAVEQWLKLNLNMLQSVIQGLEVQRATLATLNAFGAFARASMDAATGGGESKGAAPKKAASAPFGAAHAGPASAAPPKSEKSGAASNDPLTAWSDLFWGTAPRASTPGPSTPAGAAAASGSAASAFPFGYGKPTQSVTPETSAGPAGQPKGETASGAASAAAAAADAAGLDPLAWWNAMQAQFEQIVNLATPPASASTPAPASKDPGKPATPAANSAPTGAPPADKALSASAGASVASKSAANPPPRAASAAPKAPVAKTSSPASAKTATSPRPPAAKKRSGA